nr:tRNA(m5U54)methyltransferase [Polyrhizophydium stewartii]
MAADAVKQDRPGGPIDDASDLDAVGDTDELPQELGKLLETLTLSHMDPPVHVSSHVELPQGDPVSRLFDRQRLISQLRTLFPDKSLPFFNFHDAVIVEGKTRISKQENPWSVSPYRLGQQVKGLTIALAGISGAGLGLGRNDWLVCVPTTLEGEVVDAVVTSVADGVVFADLVRVVSPHKDRTEPFCPHYSVCGACQLQHVTYPAQLARKRESIVQALSGVADRLRLPASGDGADAAARIQSLVRPIVPSQRTSGYRNKIVLQQNHLDPGSSVEIVGFTRRGHPAQIIDIDYCPIASEPVNVELERLRRSVLGRRNPLMRPVKGVVHHVSETAVPANGDTVTQYIIKRAAARQREESAHGSEGRSSDTSSLPAPMPADWLKQATSERSVTITHVADSLVLRVPATGFFPINEHILPRLIEELRAAVAQHMPTKAERRLLVDSYAGVGTLSLLLAKDFDRVIGFDSDAKSAMWALKNAVENGIRNAIYAGDMAENGLISGLINADPKTTAFLCDPPSKGMSVDALNALLRFGPRLVLYLSTNAECLALDVAYLMGNTNIFHLKKENGWRPAKLPGKDLALLRANSVNRLPTPITTRIRQKRIEDLRQVSAEPVDISGFSPAYTLVSVTPFDTVPQCGNLQTLAVLVRSDMPPSEV